MTLGLSVGLQNSGALALPILDRLGIVPVLAASMTRDLVSYSGSYYAMSGSDIATIYDQSANGWNLVNYDHVNDIEPTLSGSGNSARAVFSSGPYYYTCLDTGQTGSNFTSGGNDVFLVVDPIGTEDQQMLLGRGSMVNEFFAMKDGSATAARAGGFGSGDLRVNDVVIANTQGALWTAMNATGLNVFSVEDCRLDLIGSNIRIGPYDGTWRLSGSFAEFIVTPPLSDADHSAIVADIRTFYG